MPFLESFNPFVDKVPSWPMKKLDQVSWRASRQLTQYHIDDLRRFSRAIADAIQEEKELYVEVEMEGYVNGLVERGGWELAYLPDDAPVTRSAVSWLLANWPAESDDRPTLPEESDLSDLDALQQALDYDHFQSPFSVFHTPSSSVSTDALMVPVFALFALMKVEEAVESLGWSEETKYLRTADVALVNLSIAADAAIEAMEALEAVTLYDTRDRERRSFERAQTASTLRRQELEVHERAADRRARRAASVARALAEKNARFGLAQDWVWGEWQRQQGEYGGNRVAFARTYVRLVADRFTMADGSPMKVTERTLSERWTKAARQGKSS